MAKTAGYDYVELAAASLRPEEDESVFEPILKSIQSAGIPLEACNVFVPGKYKVTGPAVDLKAVGTYMKKVLSRASRAGAKIMVFGSGDARRPPEGFPLDQARSQYAEAARLAADVAGEVGMTIAMEPLGPPYCPMFNFVSQGVEIVDKMNHPRLRVLADLFHVDSGSEPFTNITKAGDRLAHVHLATPQLPEIAGTGKGRPYDFSAFLRAVRAAGYDGRMSVEDNPGVFWEMKGDRQAAFTAARQKVLGYLKEAA
jgi:sugar phosphate isomerase/epimerase